jgi:hypothetical protein
MSNRGPDPNGKFVMNNGVEIPLGKTIDYHNPNDKNERPYLCHPEYVVYQNSQIRMRYLIQIDPDYIGEEF